MRFRFKQPVPLSLLRPPQVAANFRSMSQHVFVDVVACSSSFGLAFDIDGVILRGANPIGNSRRALRRLYNDSGSLKIPFLFLTNGGGIPESRRALELSDILGVKILPSQVVQGHSPFRNLLKRFENEFIVATGKGEPAVVMWEYGFKRVVSLDVYASHFSNIDPVAQYKRWTTIQESNCSKNSENIIPHGYSQKVKAAFVVSDPVDWGRDIQVLCDILTSGGIPGEKNWHQPPLYFAADDLQYQAAFPSERLGMGAFRISLESVFNRIHDRPLEFTCFGKPNPSVFRNAETILGHLLQTSCPANVRTGNDLGSPSFKTLYMIGDNPLVDIKGAQQAGYPWFSILTRTGVFRQRENHTQYPADLVVDTVEDAVEFVLKREDAS
ncbi:hydrolase family protein / HAD-superfamily protein [Perilla frutescens var. hirtella]|uniref:Hydrolase family protein / HAD-superfamily protein n=1 Tax=Perilla frutescens var. hirtella TaxID=608512 RepID=A0AAD4JR43_PERFH|nr:hydrolase family protein / HAD-superfamily protein [Perilla frutescens var. hirtella]